MDISILYHKGVSFEKFVNRDTDTYREKTMDIFNNIEFDNQTIEKIKSIKKEVKVLICAEIWCPDCMINVPIIEQMRQYNSNVEISIVGREGNEEFFKKFSYTEGVKIPTFVFYDKDFKELGSFVEQPRKLKGIIQSGNQPNRIIAMRKYRKGEYAQDTVNEILDILL